MQLSKIIFILSLGYMTLAESKVKPLLTFIKDLIAEEKTVIASRSSTDEKEVDQAELSNLINNNVLYLLKIPKQINNDEETQKMLMMMDALSTEMPVNFVTEAPKFDDDIEQLPQKATIQDENEENKDNNSIEDDNMAELLKQMNLRGPGVDEKVTEETDDEISIWLQNLNNPKLASQDTTNTSNEVKNGDENMAELLKQMNLRGLGVDENVTEDIRKVANIDEFLSAFNAWAPGVDE